MAKAGYVAPIAWAMLYIGLGESDRVSEWREAAVDARDTLLCYLGGSPIYDAFRSDTGVFRSLYGRHHTGSAKQRVGFETRRRHHEHLRM